MDVRETFSLDLREFLMVVMKDTLINLCYIFQKKSKGGHQC